MTLENMLTCFSLSHTGHDFLALELVNGHVHLVFSLGERPFRVRDSNKMALNDNKWHVVTVSRPSSLQHTLLVDDTLTTVTNEGSSDTLDLQGFLYLGGCLTSAIIALNRLLLITDHIMYIRRYESKVKDMEVIN